jgi:FG-GAP repeat
VQMLHADVLTVAALAAAAMAQPTQLVSSSPSPGMGFGACVAIDGDTLVVGAPYDRAGGTTEEGSVSVRHWDGSQWQEEALLRIPPGIFAPGAHFGASIAISGDTIVVGAPDAAAAWEGLRKGYAFTYRRSAGVWTWETLVGGSGGTSNSFGAAVAISGQTMIVSEPGDDSNGTYNTGSVFVFDRIGDGWSWRQKLTAWDRGSSDYFGNAVAISGDTIVVGVMRDDVLISYFPLQNNYDQGSARVFTRSAGQWTETAVLVDPAGEPNDTFGNSVAVDGSTVVVGSSRDSNSHGMQAGSVHVFRPGSEGWFQADAIYPPTDEYFQWFGSSVSISGSTILVGAESVNGSFENQGAAYVFVDGAAGYTREATLLAPDGAYNDHFGFATGLSGDKAIIGAPYDIITQSQQGSAWVFTRSGGDWTTPWCAADFNRDGGVDGADIEAFFDAWTIGDPIADVNLDGGVDGADLEAFFTLWMAGGC